MLVAPAHALEYTIDEPEDYLFGRPNFQRPQVAPGIVEIRRDLCVGGGLCGGVAELACAASTAHIHRGITTVRIGLLLVRSGPGGLRQRSGRHPRHFSSSVVSFSQRNHQNTTKEIKAMKMKHFVSRLTAGIACAALVFGLPLPARAAAPAERAQALGPFWQLASDQTRYPP